MAWRRRAKHHFSQGISVTWDPARAPFSFSRRRFLRPRHREIARVMARRGAEILAFGLLFRLQEYLIAWGWAPWSDLFRVDVLNIIGLSMILMALTCGFVLTVWKKLDDSCADMPTGDSYQGTPSGIPKSVGE